VPGKQYATDRPAPWESGLVIVDKPGGMTSHDVVARVRRLAHTRRVGHAGTLDPMATGVLVIGVEKATRLLGHLMLTEKTYEATIRLGQSTSTDDAEGEPTGTALRPASEVTRAALDTEIAKLTGEILQVPSSVSAIKVNGQRAYKLTRAGEAPELAARPVTVYEFLVHGVSKAGDFMDVDARVRCSSGTYIRALARDLGTALGTGGHLTALRRTAVGPYDIAMARTLEDLENQALPSVIPLADAAAAAFPRVDLTADDARRLAQGARLPVPPDPPHGDQPHGDRPHGDRPHGDQPHGDQPHGDPPPALRELNAVPDRSDVPRAAFDPDGTLVALVTVEDGRLRSLAVFVDAAAKTRDA
jgi:tRNA pseudouridine55 synthase